MTIMTFIKFSLRQHLSPSSGTYANPSVELSKARHQASVQPLNYDDRAKEQVNEDVILLTAQPLYPRAGPALDSKHPKLLYKRKQIV